MRQLRHHGCNIWKVVLFLSFSFLLLSNFLLLFFFALFLEPYLWNFSNSVNKATNYCVGATHQSDKTNEFSNVEEAGYTFSFWPWNVQYTNFSIFPVDPRFVLWLLAGFFTDENRMESTLHIPEVCMRSTGCRSAMSSTESGMYTK